MAALRPMYIRTTDSDSTETDPEVCNAVAIHVDDEDVDLVFLEMRKTNGMVAMVAMVAVPSILFRVGLVGIMVHSSSIISYRWVFATVIVVYC